MVVPLVTTTNAHVTEQTMGMYHVKLVTNAICINHVVGVISYSMIPLKIVLVMEHVIPKQRVVLVTIGAITIHLVLAMKDAILVILEMSDAIAATQQ